MSTVKIGELIKDHRKARNLSLRELEQQTGVDKSTLSRMENNKGIPQRKHWISLIRWILGE